ncbi:MAG: ATP-binding cassette domain-containing protein [Candidatus Babeliales bacterium]
MNIIETKNLTKTFTSGSSVVTAVNGIDLAIRQGEIFGLLGTNGAGKTTTMRMLTTLLKPTDGTAIIGGFDLLTQEMHVRLCIGYVSQSGGLERSATGRENLILQAKIYNFSDTQAHERAKELITALGLEAFADRLVETYSGGQRRRFDIALGIVHKPKILFLDEPTVGLDPHNRALLWQEIKKLNEAGTTIIITTHYLDEADALCNRIAIVDQGKIVALDTPAALKRAIGKDVIALTIAPEKMMHAKELLMHLDGVKESFVHHDELHLAVQDGATLLPKLLHVCNEHNIQLRAIALHQPTLDDVFLTKAGRTFESAN